MTDTMTEALAQELIRKTPQYTPAPCPWCNATTVDEASQKCHPTIMMCGDYRCGTPEDAPETDGKLHQINPVWAKLDGYLWGWHAVHEGLTATPPEWEGDNA